MTRHLFILSGRDPDLYSYLKERFAGDAAVELIVDRRQGHRGRTAVRYPIDRRKRPDADAELLTRSYTIVTVSDSDVTGVPPRSRLRAFPVETSRLS